MEFNERLQELRKQKGLTQEELAEALYVSRTAVSKWESGRGYPNIDSLKALSKYFSVTIDELLSGGEALAIAENNSGRKNDTVFAIIDVSTAAFFFMPLFGQNVNSGITSVSLTGFSGEPYMKAAYIAVVAAIIISGAALFALKNCRSDTWKRVKYKISLALNAAGTLLFIIGRQPYSAGLLFIFLAVKAAMAAKWR